MAIQRQERKVNPLQKLIEHRNELEQIKEQSVNDPSKLAKLISIAEGVKESFEKIAKKTVFDHETVALCYDLLRKYLQPLMSNPSTPAKDSLRYSLILKDMINILKNPPEELSITNQRTILIAYTSLTKSGEIDGNMIAELELILHEYLKNNLDYLQKNSAYLSRSRGKKTDQSQENIIKIIKTAIGNITYIFTICDYLDIYCNKEKLGDKFIFTAIKLWEAIPEKMLQVVKKDYNNYFDLLLTEYTELRRRLAARHFNNGNVSESIKEFSDHLKIFFKFQLFLHNNSKQSLQKSCSDLDKITLSCLKSIDAFALIKEGKDKKVIIGLLSELQDLERLWSSVRDIAPVKHYPSSSIVPLCIRICFLFYFLKEFKEGKKYFEKFIFNLNSTNILEMEKSEFNIHSIVSFYVRENIGEIEGLLLQEDDVSVIKHLKDLSEVLCRISEISAQAGVGINLQIFIYLLVATEYGIEFGSVEDAEFFYKITQVQAKQINTKPHDLLSILNDLERRILTKKNQSQSLVESDRPSTTYIHVQNELTKGEATYTSITSVGKSDVAETAEASGVTKQENQENLIDYNQERHKHRKLSKLRKMLQSFVPESPAQPIKSPPQTRRKEAVSSVMPEQEVIDVPYGSIWHQLVPSVKDKSKELTAKPVTFFNGFIIKDGCLALENSSYMSCLMTSELLKKCNAPVEFIDKCLSVVKKKAREEDDQGFKPLHKLDFELILSIDGSKRPATVLYEFKVLGKFGDDRILYAAVTADDSNENKDESTRNILLVPIKYFKHGFNIVESLKNSNRLYEYTRDEIRPNAVPRLSIS